MKKSVYFLIAKHEKYNDLALHLAEGLLEIGIPFYCNRNFWRLEPKKLRYLFKKNKKVKPTDCSVIIITTLWFHYINNKTFKSIGKKIPDYLFKKNRSYKLVLLDGQDGYHTVSRQSIFRGFDHVFRAHMNKRTFNPKNYFPWVLGFGTRVIRATTPRVNFKNKHSKIVLNFGYTHKFQHGVRTIAIQKFINSVCSNISIDRRITLQSERPRKGWDNLMWQQTEGKHNPSYYRQLQESRCVACFCGEFVPGIPNDPSLLLVGGGRARILRKIYSLTGKILCIKERIIQWDSWRFWECLLAGSVAIHVDLEKYGVILPVMPINWRHYVGIDFDDLKFSINKFLRLTKFELQEIARAGRIWALKNYSPSSSALRFLEKTGL